MVGRNVAKNFGRMWLDCGEVGLMLSENWDIWKALEENGGTFGEILG
jgi:hypothetical protein